MKQNIIVLSANSYKMENEGKIREGVSIRYLPCDNLAPVKEGDNVGIKVAKESLPISWKDLFVAAPALYQADMVLRVNSEGRPIMAIKSIDFLGEITISPDTKATK